MTLALAETRSRVTAPRLRRSLSQECTVIRFLSMLIKQLRWLRQGELEFFDSDVAADTEATELTRHDDLTRVCLWHVEIEAKVATENDTDVHRDPDEELLRFLKDIPSVAIGPAISEEDEDLLDWDAYIETPPAPSRSGTIKVRFKYIGRSKPIPVNDPWAQ